MTRNLVAVLHSLPIGTGARTAFLHDSLRLLTNAHRAYAHSDDGSRRLANQAFYTRLEITEDE